MSDICVCVVTTKTRTHFNLDNFFPYITLIVWVITCSSDLDMSIPQLGTQVWIKSFNMSTHDKWRAWFVEGQVAG